MAKELLHRLDLVLEPSVRRTLGAAMSLAESRNSALFLVGGAVRDLLLGMSHLDVDLVVEGNAIELADELALRVGARVTSHPRFCTASVKGTGLHFDLASARSEVYNSPGALPAVFPGSISEDLARRDFTINAMALGLTGEDAGTLVDRHRGEADLGARVIRVLHDHSFQDDPTRLLRAVRYAGRLDFRVEKRTEFLLRRDLGYLESVSGARLRRELEHIAMEERVAAIISLASNFGILTALRVSGCVVARQMAAIDDVRPGARESMFFALLLARGTEAQAEAAMSRLALTTRQTTAVRGVRELLSRATRLGEQSLPPSQIVSLLSDMPVEAVDALALLTDSHAVRERAHRYLSEWRFVRPQLNGQDVEDLGVAHGPDVGATLAALRIARLDGKLRTRDDEVTFVVDRAGDVNSFADALRD